MQVATSPGSKDTGPAVSCLLSWVRERAFLKHLTPGADSHAVRSPSPQSEFQA